MKSLIVQTVGQLINGPCLQTDGSAALARSVEIAYQNRFGRIQGVGLLFAGYVFTLKSLLGDKEEVEITFRHPEYVRTMAQLKHVDFDRNIAVLKPWHGGSLQLRVSLAPKAGPCFIVDSRHGSQGIRSAHLIGKRKQRHYRYKKPEAVAMGSLGGLLFDPVEHFLGFVLEPGLEDKPAIVMPARDLVESCYEAQDSLGLELTFPEG